MQRLNVVKYAHSEEQLKALEEKGFCRCEPAEEKTGQQKEAPDREETPAPKGRGAKGKPGGKGDTDETG